MSSPAFANPFPGLRPFRTDEDYLFFGREGQSEDILRRLRLSRFLAVVGISGSGKSSLIRAGLLPYLFGGFMANTSSDWRVALLRPGNNPIGNMAHALSDCAVLGDAGSGETDAVKNEILLEVTLRRSGLGLVEAVRLAHLPEGHNLLIVVDQFEELFRYGHAGNTVRQQDEASAFVKLLFEATQQSALPIYIVITMRSDFIGDCARFRDLPEAVTAGLYLIPRMSREQRRKAIEEPVHVGGGTISRRLINRLLNDGGDDPDQLPSLQHALMRSWIYWQEHAAAGEPIDLEHYLAVGGISDALSRHAEEALADLPDERSRAIAKRLFQSLTEKGPDNREVRRPTKLADIASMAGASLPEVVTVIDSFRREGRSFLTPPPDVPLDSESIIDISHESLIRGWDRLKNWVEEEYESAKTYRRLAETAALYAEGKAGLWHDPDLANALRWSMNERPTEAWAKSYHPAFKPAMAFLEESRRARDEGIAQRERERRHKLRNARIFAAALMILLLVAAGAAFFASQEKKVANENEQKAKENARVALKERDNANTQKQIALTKKKEADEATLQAEMNQDMALGFASSTVRGLSELSDFTLSLNEVHDNFESLLKEAAKVHDKVVAKNGRNFTALVMRVNELSALVRLHSITGRSEMARKECAEEEADALDLAKVGSNQKDQILSAYMLAELAGIRRNLGDKDRALADAKRAINIAGTIDPRQYSGDNTVDQQALRCLSIVYSESANVERRYGDSKAALKHNLTAIKTLAGGEDLSAAATSRYLDDRSRSILLSDMRALGALQKSENLTDAAVATYSKGIHLAKAWKGEDVDDHVLMDRLFWLYIDRADMEVSLKHYPQACDDFQRAKVVAASKETTSNDAQYDSGVAVERLGTLSHYLSNDEKEPGLKRKELLEARELHGKALEYFKRLEEKRGKSPQTEHNIGLEEQNLAWDSTALLLPADAKQHREAARISHELAAEVDQEDEYVTAAAGSNRNMAAIEQDAGNWKAAVPWYARAVLFDTKISQVDADSFHTLLQDVRSLANAEIQSDEPGRGQEALTDGLARCEQWSKAQPLTPLLAKDLVLLHLDRGDALLKKKAYSEADKDYHEAERNLSNLDKSSGDDKAMQAFTFERFGVYWKQQADELKTATKKEYLLRAKSFQENALSARLEMRAVSVTAELEQGIGISQSNLGWIDYELKNWSGSQAHLTASAEAYHGALKLESTAAAVTALQKSYLSLASVYVLQAEDELSQGHNSQADAAFAAARAAANHENSESVEGQSLRAQIEEYIATSLRTHAESGKDPAHHDELLRRAIQADLTALELRRQISATQKTAEAEQAVENAQTTLGADYSSSMDQENARKYFRLSLKTLQKSKPGNQTARATADSYRSLAELELKVEDWKAARDAISNEIEALKPLTESTNAVAADRLNLAIALGLRSYSNLMLGDAWTALTDAEQGLFVDGSQNFIQINKADAYLCMGQVEAAKKLYLTIADKPLSANKLCRTSILEDLQDIRKHGLKVDPKVLASLENELKEKK